jgi:hypothetical protein
MKVLYVKNPVYATKDNTSIECMVKFDVFEQELHFHATPDDTAEHGRQIYQDLKSGKYGPIANYKPKPIEDLDPGKQGGPKIVA